MPCNGQRIWESAVVFDKALLKVAVEALGGRVEVRASDGRVNIWVPGYPYMAAWYDGKELVCDREKDGFAIKREYTRQAVHQQAKKHGWKVREKINARGNVQFEVEKNG